jgi:hypothetical protein
MRWWDGTANICFGNSIPPPKSQLELLLEEAQQRVRDGYQRGLQVAARSNQAIQNQTGLDRWSAFGASRMNVRGVSPVHIEAFGSKHVDHLGWRVLIALDFK